MFTERDKEFIIKLKNKGYSKEDTLKLLDKARIKNGLEPISKPTTPKSFIDKQVVNKPVEKGYSILNGIGNLGKGLYSIADGANSSIRNFEQGALSQIPTITGNVAGGVTNVLGDVTQKIGGLFGTDISDEQKTKLGNWFKKIGKQGTEELLNILGTDKGAFSTKSGQFAADVGSMFVGPGMAKVPSLIRGAVTGAKGELVSEGEISPEGVIVGAAVDKGLNVAGKALDKFLPKTKEQIEKKLNLKGLVKISSKGGKDIKSINNEYNKALEGGKMLIKKNPSFVLKKGKNQSEISQIGELINKEKDEIIRNMTNVRGSIGKDAIINSNELINKLNTLKKDNNFKVLLEEGGGRAEFNRLKKLLYKKVKDPVSGKMKNAPKDINIEELYNKIKFLNKDVGKALTSADNTKAQIGSYFAKIYNDTLDSKLGTLGNKYKNIKSEYNKIRSFENGIAKELKKEMQRSGSNILNSFGDAALDSSIVFNLFNPLVAGQAALTKVLKNTFAKEKNPNELLKKFVKDVRLLYGYDTPLINQGIEKKLRDVTKKVTTLGIEKITK